MTKEEILARLHKTRISIGRDTYYLRRELDFKAKAAAVVRKNPLAWISGAAALGWWIAGPKTKKRVVTKVVADPLKRAEIQKKARSAGPAGFLGIAIALLRFAFPYLKPALTTFAVKKLTEFSARAHR